MICERLLARLKHAVRQHNHPSIRQRASVSEHLCAWRKIRRGNHPPRRDHSSEAHTGGNTLTGYSCVKAPQRTTKGLQRLPVRKALTKSCLPISANHSRYNAHRCAHSPSITSHHHTHRLTTCKTSCSTQPALLITTAAANPPPTETTSNVKAAAAAAGAPQTYAAEQKPLLASR